MEFKIKLGVRKPQNLALLQKIQEFEALYNCPIIE